MVFSARQPPGQPLSAFCSRYQKQGARCCFDAFSSHESVPTLGSRPRRCLARKRYRRSSSLKSLFAQEKDTAEIGPPVRFFAGQHPHSAESEPSPGPARLLSILTGRAWSLVQLR